MKVKETRWMDMDDLRGLCIKHGWFTRGDCKAYDKIGNTLTDPMHDGDDPTAYWYTPGYFSSVWQLRRIFRSMDRLFEEAG